MTGYATKLVENVIMSFRANNKRLTKCGKKSKS